MPVSRLPGCRTASPIEPSPLMLARRWMRPGVLDIGRQDGRSALFQRGGGDIDVEKAQLRADAGIKGGLCRHVLTPRAFGVATVLVKNALVAGRLITALTHVNRVYDGSGRRIYMTGRGMIEGFHAS